MLAAAVVAVGCGGEATTQTEPAPEQGRAAAEGRRLQRAGLRHRAAGGQEPRVRGRAGRHDPGAQRLARSRPSWTSRTSSSPAASRACCRWPSRPTTRRAGCSTSTTPTRTATSRSSSTSAPPTTRPIRTRARQVLLHARRRGQPQRRPAAVRARQAALHRHRRRRWRRRPARPRAATARTSATLLGKILRIDPKAGRRQAVHDPGRQPVPWQALRRAAGDLRLRPAQPVAVLVRPLQRRDDDRRRRPGRVGGDQLPREGQGRGRELRLARVRGRRALRGRRERAGPRQAGDRRVALRGQLLDHRRLRDPRPGAEGVARALRVRRLLPRRDPDAPTPRAAR